MDTKTIVDKKTWEDFLEKHNEANFLQSWYWGEFHERIGHKINRTGFFVGGKLVGVMLSIVERGRRATYLTVPGGPIIDWLDKQVVEAFVRAVRTLATENNCVFVRVRPQIEDSTQSRKVFQNLNFRVAPMHLHAELTSRLDINRTEEELLSNMRKATRYEIKKAIKLGIKVTDEHSDKMVNTFLKLQNNTAKRQKFVPFGEKFLTAQFEVFISNNLAKLYTAKLKNRILAQAFIIFYGKEAVYHYGASNAEGRHYPGAYLIQWEAIRQAKKRGMNVYNFWGVAPSDSNSHRFAGLSLFKRGFGGQDFAYLPARDLVIDWKRYLFDYIIEKSRRILRRV